MASLRPRAHNQPAMVPSFTTLLARLERWLSEHRPRYEHALRPGASAGELDALQAKLGLPLPADLRALLAWHNGQDPDYPGTFVESWALMGTEEIRAAKHELDAARPSGWQQEWIPFLDDQGGDYCCLDTGQDEAPMREFTLGRPEHVNVAISLAAWLGEFLTTVVHGAYVEDPERGHFLRRKKP